MAYQFLELGETRNAVARLTLRRESKMSWPWSREGRPPGDASASLVSRHEGDFVRQPLEISAAELEADDYVWRVGGWQSKSCVAAGITYSYPAYHPDSHDNSDSYGNGDPFYPSYQYSTANAYSHIGNPAYIRLYRTDRADSISDHNDRDFISDRYFGAFPKRNLGVSHQPGNRNHNAGRRRSQK